MYRVNKYPFLKKTAFVVSLAALLVAIPAFSGHAFTRGGNVSLDTKKDVVTAIADAALAKITPVKGKIQNNNLLSEQTKQELVNTLDQLEQELNDYKVKVEQATTQEEISAANQELRQYIQDHRNVLIDSIREAVANLGKQLAEKARQLHDQVFQLLQILKRTCPSESATITTLEQQLLQLENEVATLGKMVKSGDATAIRAQMKVVKDLSHEINVNVQKLQKACNIPI
jgi:hypothetical protein